MQTEADRSAQLCIVGSLAKQFPALHIIGEEGATNVEDVPSHLLNHSVDADFLQSICPSVYQHIREEDLVVWVDPLDGTAEYTKGFLEHVTVLIGVSYQNRAIGGIIHQPFFANDNAALGRTIWGLRELGTGGFEAGTAPNGQFVVTTTRSHCTDLVQSALDSLSPSSILRVGGAGFKVIQLLEGKAHAYVFASPGCKKWDTCAPEAVLEAAGGRLTDISGDVYQYGANVSFPNLGGVLATARGVSHESVVTKIPDQLKKELSSSKL